MTTTDTSTSDTGPARRPKDPSVVVGMACRVPGATNPRDLWEVLEQRKDLQRKMPEDRYNADSFYHPQGTNKGTSNARYGYYLDQGLDQFDAQFFNISGKEAEAMDPQQRLLLEVVYEALEDAGITLDQIRGTRTSVYCGSFTYDYESMTHRNLEHYPKYSITGLANTILPNRVSFFFDLHGPSVQVDTACSSSLTCFHLGNQSLQSGESEISIIAGTALHFDPTIFITMTDFGMLSTDGRCRHFDADGSGYVRGDGICAIVLKKQSAAEMNGDNIRAIVRGSGANHDGSKEGLTMPNPVAQATLLRDTYSAAGLSPKDTGYFEAHGTGTKAGDPREAQAIGTVFAPGRDEPLYVGSIKTNLGHLEGASGLISIIKASLCLEKGKILPNMHFNKPNPEIDFEKLKIRVPQQVIDWNPSNGVRRASINSFGFGGSNAHVILENYPGTCHAEARSLVSGVASTPSRPFLLPLTSHSEDGGKRLVKSVAAYLGSSSKVSTCDLAYSLSSRRTLHSYRSFAIGHNNADISRELASPRAEARWQRSTNNPRVGFIFTGQGAQWYGMGRQLIEENSFFRQKLLECENVLQRLPEPPNWSIIEELTKSPEETRVALSQFSQPLCTAIQIALVDVLKVWNIEPTAVCGHSSGEIAAAYVAGILSLDSAIICAYYRGLYMSKGLGSTQGGMMAIGMTEPEGMIELQKYKGRIVIAAINSQSSLTVSGDKDAILELKAHLDARKVFARVLQVEQAFHSHHMEPLAPGFEKALESSKDFTPMHAKVRMFSSVTARDSSARIMDASYWSSNMTGKVRFMDAVIGILFDDNEEPAVDLLVEIGPHPALQGPVRQTIKSMGLEIPYIASLDRKVPAYESLLSCAGQLFAYGHQVDLTAVNSEHTVAEDGSAHRAVIGKYLNDLPTYAWDHKSYWSETRYSKEYRKRTHRHSLIGVPVPGSPANHRRWHSYLRGSELPWIYGHAIDGKVIFPGAGYFAMALEAVSTTIPTDRVKDIVLTDVTITSALTIPDTDVGAEVMIDLMSLETTSSRSLYKFAIYSFNDDQQTIEHCNGTVSANLGLIEESKIEHSFMDLQQRTTQSRSPRRFYERLHKMGLHYGKEFQLISGDIESSPDFAIAPLVYKPSTVNADEADACILHPAFLDCAFHTLFAALETQLGHALDDAYIPTSLRSLRVSGNLLARKNDTNDQAFWVKAQTSVLNSRINSSDISIHDGQSETCVVHLEGLECTALGLGAGEDGLRPLFFRIRWKEAFSCLGLSADSWGFEDLDTLLECYSHQYPGNKILYTPAEGSIAKEEEEEEGYDLVVCSQDYNHDPAKLLKPGGFAISTGAHFDGGTLKQKVRFGNVAIWQSESLPSSGDQLILILSSSPSAKATDLAHAIMESFHQEAMITTLEAITENAPKSGSFVSLLSLDEDVLLDTATVQSTQFLALRDLLATRKSNIVWLLENVTQSYFNPSQSLLIGMARTARSENENLRLVTLDLPEACDTKSTCKWIKHVLDPSLQDDEFAVRDGRLFIPRVEIDTKLNQKIAVGPRIQRQLQPISHDRHLRLRIETPGKLETLIFEEDVASREAPLPSGDVEILVKASVVDNTDISAISGDQRSARLGRFCVGVITKISESIGGTSLKVGDHVFAYCSKGGAHASVVRVSTSAVCHLGNVDFLSAGHAGLPLLAANYSLHQLARIQADDYCLIYNAASVAGQLAIQVALRAGARVIAIVHLPEEQANLRSRFCLPANSILLRSDEGFAQRIQRLTGRKGCHVLLNCGTSSLPPGALESLSASGLVVEFSSSDRMMSSHDSLRSNTKYTFVDLNVLFTDHPELGALLLRDSFEMLDSEEIVVPEDVATFPYSQSAEAFRTLLANPDLGHVLLHVTDDSVPVAALTYGATRLFSPEKTYLVVGGLGGIGRSLSQWMFRKGALRFAFLSRSGKDKPEAQATIEWLEKRGAMVSVYRGDVTNESDVRNCVNKIEGSLGGVFQGAMVLQSCPLSEMTPDAWQKVIDPKVKGSYNLHYATIDRHLDFFVCFSSISTIIGFMAEANYSAANSFMDHFIGWRRRQGLPGFAMNIGVVADAGQIAENEGLRAIIDRMGMDTLSEEELFYQIEEAVLSQHDPHSSLDGVVHHQLLSGINVGTKELFWSSKPLFRKLYADIKGGAADSGNDRQEDLVSALRTAEGLEAMKPVLLGAFAEKISSALSIPLSVIHPGSPLSAYGMDSLVAVEFRKWFSKDVGVDLALFDILGSKTTGLLVESVCKLFLANASLKIESQPLSRDVTESKNSGSLAAITNKTFTMVRPQRIPLSTFQTRLWFMHNIMEDKAGLNLSVTLMIKGSPQLTHLKRAFVELGRRNEMLRTRYFEGNDFAEQQVLPTITTEIQYLDISSDHDPAQSVVSQAEKLRKYPTDLESGDVIRSMLLDLGNLQYAWIFSIHHIAVDGGSRKSFMEQLVSCYNDVSTGQDSSTVSAPPLSYVDFALWHEKNLKSSQVGSDLAWWKDSLAGATPTSKLLPFALHDRPEKASSERSIVRAIVKKADLKRMKRICSRVDVTPFHFLLAALRAFIYRYTSEEDLTLLVVNGDRPHPAFEGILGFFVNMIPLRWRGEFNGSFEDLLTEAKSLAIDSLAHSQAPFDSIVETMDMGWNPRHFPLGQIAVNYQMYAKSPKYLTKDFEIFDTKVDDIATACEIQLEAIEDPETGLDLRLEYDSFLYGEDDMARFFENFSTFIQSAINDFRQPIEEIEMCGPLEMRILRENCWTEELSSRTWKDQPLWVRFKEVARQHPEYIAIRTSTGETATYAELLSKAEETAAYFQGAGVRPGDRVGILGYPSIEVVAAMLSTSCLRCVYVPLDPDFAQQRLVYMIQDSKCSIVFFGPSMASLVTNLRDTTISSFLPLLTEAASLDQQLNSQDASSQDVFYIVYTSGSTGKPKGVVVSHESTKAMLAGRNQVHNITSTDIILSHSSISFDISITQMWGAFVEGATVALATLDTRQDINELAIFIREARVTMTFFTPTQFAMIVEHSSEELRQCPDLRTASFIGEHLQPRLVRAIYDLKIPVTIWNEYGPSETTSQNTIYAVPYPGPDDRSIHIGRALPNSSVYIVNPRLKPVPVGVSGELCIGGPQVSQGYLSTSATMSCVFVENPFVSGPFRSHGWTRLYRTGDHAKFLRDGVIDLGGRISGDKQIKLRGHRIDTTEIESEIQRIPAGDEALPTIARTVVLARVLQGSTTQSLTDDRQLVAFVVSKSADSRLENQHIANTLQDRLRKTLNSYMVPSCYQFLTDLPTTVSGKVNRAQLMDMKLDPIFPEGSGRAAAQNNRTIEKGHNVLQAIKDAYRVVLKLPADLQIDDHDNFFRLGGQSVLVLRLQKTLKTKIDVQLRLMDLFKNATPLALNTIIEGEAKNLSSAISSSVRRSLDIDWDEEIKLPQDDRYWPKDPVLGLRPTIPTVSGVLLVGADGFVGYYLLRFLLTVDSQAKVYLLSVENRLSLGELINSLSRYQLFDSKLTQSDLMRRVEIIPGTMAQDRFGLDAEEFDRLGQNVQSILHTGGFVSLLQTYTDLKERNVKSVRTMIELASCSRATTPTSLHYISTWSVLHMQTWKTTLQKKDGPVFTDEQTAESFQPPRTDDSGYIKTRWVSEMLMEEAGRRGFPTTIYRCPAHTAPIESTAVTPSDNFTINLYLSMIKAGIVPRSLVRNDGLESVVNSVPIDYLADTLVRLAGREDSRIVKHEACRLHVTNPSPMPFVKMSDMIAQVRCDRRPGTVMDIDEWFQSVLVHHTGNESQRLEWTMYKEYLDVGHTMFALDDRKSRPILAEIDMMDSDTRVRCPPVDAVYLGRLMAQKDLADKLA